MSVVDMFFVWGQSCLTAFWNVYNFLANKDLKPFVSGCISAIGTLLSPTIGSKAAMASLGTWFHLNVDSFTVFDLLFSEVGIIAFFALSLFVLVKRAVF